MDLNDAHILQHAVQHLHHGPAMVLTLLAQFGNRVRQSNHQRPNALLQNFNPFILIFRARGWALAGTDITIASRDIVVVGFVLDLGVMGVYNHRERELHVSRVDEASGAKQVLTFALGASAVLLGNHGACLSLVRASPR